MKRKRKIFRRFCKGFGLAVLVCALFLAFRPEGDFVVSASNPDVKGSKLILKIITWNVRCGEDGDFLGANWNKRRISFSKLLTDNNYDVICLQEVLPGQLAFFKSTLEDFQCVTAGREDGKNKGEHCPIFFRRERFLLNDSGAFWLSDTPDKPSRAWEGIWPRVCTWVELEDSASGERFRVYNTHMQISPYAQYRGAKVLVGHFEEAKVPLILTGDTNCPGNWPAVKALKKTGLREIEQSGALTYHFKGKGIRCLDHILIQDRWAVTEGGLIKEKGGRVYPSDHFGLWAKLKLSVSEENTVDSSH